MYVFQRLFSNEGSVNAEAIMKLLKVNHCLLKSLGVSHEVLDEIVTICEQYGLGAKLTGGGGGGMVLLLIESQNTPDRLDSLLSRLSMRGFRTFVTKLTNQGLDMK